MAVAKLDLQGIAIGTSQASPRDIVPPTPRRETTPLTVEGPASTAKHTSRTLLVQTAPSLASPRGANGQGSHRRADLTSEGKQAIGGWMDSAIGPMP